MTPSSSWAADIGSRFKREGTGKGINEMYE